MICYVMMVHRSDQKIANLYYDSAVVNYDCNLFIRMATDADSLTNYKTYFQFVARIFHQFSTVETTL